MLGGMLAGHEESGGRIVEENGEKFMLFYGMSSESAMKRHVGGVAPSSIPDSAANDCAAGKRVKPSRKRCTRPPS